MGFALNSCAPLLLAMLFDQALGDPPNRFHPVAWMGSAINLARRLAPREGNIAQLLYGAGLALVGTAAVAAIGLLLQHVLVRLPWPINWMVEAYVLKLTLSLRSLAGAARQVWRALKADDLSQARHLVGWHLVSRDTSRLEPFEVSAAAIESVAENSSDGIVAPLFYYALGGLPAALAYRFINTSDAMLGYRDDAHEWLGKVPARLDDVVNWIPSRLTAILIVMATMPLGDFRLACWTWWRDARLTESPNAGHPMSSMAGALNIELEKMGYYRLGAGYKFATADDIPKAIRILYVTVALAVIGMCLLRLIATSLWL
jgi:adenosylcobinamide-phosphate synthase